MYRLLPEQVTWRLFGHVAGNDVAFHCQTQVFPHVTTLTFDVIRKCHVETPPVFC